MLSRHPQHRVRLGPSAISAIDKRSGGVSAGKLWGGRLLSFSTCGICCSLLDAVRVALGIKHEEILTKECVCCKVWYAFDAN